ncbi:HEAT repeat-containing protein 2 [Physocladia obscura]|uniref:HEAT repeat-containing protein 2 n=1 Tax=Physocladia obscura TaxID=109957 RepID=A0AAD5XGA7_9FUNG|nr:HEAT repeat-containing protein 2 [Physocladia obscura]
MLVDSQENSVTPMAIPEKVDILKVDDADDHTVVAPETLDMDENSSKISVVWSLLRKLTHVKDIGAMRISLPANLMDPRSNLEFWNYNDRPDLFACMADPEEPVERMVHVLRWFLCKDTKWKEKAPEIRKPYNPVLGEIFKCEWNADPSAGKTFVDADVSKLLAGRKTIKVACLTEQLVHNPSISAFYYECKKKGVMARGVDHVAAKFTGTALKFGAGEHNYGIFVNLEKWNEEYNLTYPWASVGGWLTGHPYITVSENTTIICKESGLRCILHYKDEPYFAGPKFLIEGKIYKYDEKSKDIANISKVPDSQVVAKIWGSWNGKIYAKLIDSGAEGMIIDIQESVTAPKILNPVEDMEEVESRRMWYDVTTAIEEKRYADATRLKREIEDRQRKIRASMAGEYVSRFFDFKVPVGVKITDDELFEERGKPYLKGLARDLNVATDAQAARPEKTRALNRIHSAVIQTGFSKQQTSTLAAAIVPALLRVINDSAEKCRELSIETISDLVSQSNDLIPVLPFIIPAISSRLSLPEIMESSEEIRLLLVKLLLSITNKTKSVFSPGVDEAVKIVLRTITDPFSEVKKESCNLIISLATHCPRQTTLHAVSLTKSLIPILQHRHAAVRTQILRAIHAVVILDATPLSDLADPLRALTLDKSQLVREVLYETAAAWLLTMPDRYSVGYKVLPTLLAGLVDDAIQLRTRSYEKLDEIGALYEAEWPDRVKADLDYHHIVGSDRPRVGIRHLARDNTQKIVGKVVDGLQDWNVEIRTKAAAILSAFVPLTETNITGYMGSLLPAIYKVLASDETAVLNETMKATELIGKYVDPDLYLHLLLSHSTSNPDAPTPFSIGCLRTLGAILSGTPANKLTNMHRMSVANTLIDNDLVGNENIPLLLEVANVAKVLAVKMSAVIADERDSNEGYTLFIVLLTLLSVRGNEKVPGWTETMFKTESALSDLSKSHGLTSANQLFPIYFERTLESFTLGIHSWTRFSTGELRALDTLLVKSGSCVGQNLEAVISLIGKGVSLDKDIEVRESLLTTFVEILKSSPTQLNSANNLSLHAVSIINNIVIPSAVWRPGRKTAATRGLGMEILANLLDPKNSISIEEYVGFVPASALNAYLKEDNSFIPVTTACLEEDEVGIRSVAIVALSYFLSGAAASNALFYAQNFKLIYPELLKRLDDASDAVRILGCTAFTNFARAVVCFYSQHTSQADGVNGYLDGNEKYVESRLDDVHWIEIIKGIAIHLDDVNSYIQDAAESALLSICKVAPEVIAKNQLNLLRTRFRNVNRIDHVIELVW